VFVFLLALPWFLVSVGLRLDEILVLPPLDFSWRAAGWVVGPAGFAGVVWTMAFLSTRGRGLPVSHLPPERFVDTGPYRIVRHPIYVAFTLALSGSGLAFGSAGVAFGAAGFLLAGWLIYVLGFEEPRLIARFGAEYEAYRQRVPVVRFPGRRTLALLASRAWKWVRPAVERCANMVVLFRIGPSVWVTYGALLALGGATMAGLSGALLVRGGWSSGESIRALVWLAIVIVASGRLTWLAYRIRDLISRPARTMRTVGFVSWGAVIGGIVFPFLYSLGGPGDPLWLMDRIFIALLPCTTLGRLGCLTYGCCFGRDTPHGVAWHHPAAKVNRELGAPGSSPRVPTQLIEALGAIVVFAIAVGITRTPAPAGTVTGVILVLYGMLRTAVDCWRDEDRFGAWQLTAGQVGSIAVGIFGFALIFLARGGPGWSRPALPVGFEEVWSVAPAVLACGAIVFFVTGFHWKNVGRW
jgi:prolipoprotein diacylglyceryltransferase/protein-S-isoprenylcysteine O-methyltransferase Ste14